MTVRETHSMTPEEQEEFDRRCRLAGKEIIDAQALRQVRTFLDELRNGTRNYRTVASLRDQVAQEYRGRAILELLQNAHDVLPFASNHDPRRISFVLRSAREPELLVANSGRPFLTSDFIGICQLAQSPKDPNESVGNKGLGFQSVLELSTCPQVWSTVPTGSNIAFAFGFDPRVCEPIARTARSLLDGDRPTDPAFNTESIVNWSQAQINEYRCRLFQDDINPVDEVKKYLSPYVVPQVLDKPPAEVARLLEDGHVTVIRLPLDGGKTGSPGEAVDSVREQLRSLDEAAMVFLRHLSVLHIDVDEDRVELTRKVHSELSCSDSATRKERLQVSRVEAAESYPTERSFHLWSRIVGGEDDPIHADRIAAAVRHLPNRWPKIRQVELAVAVEETPNSCPGVYVIFLPTDKETTVGAHINAPFYGSLNRRQIYFDDQYNKLLLEFVADLILDATIELVEEPPEPWRGRAVIDLVASRMGDNPQSLTNRLRQRAHDRGRPLHELALILCDDGWGLPELARTMPTIPDDDPIGRTAWRRQAGFTVVSSALDDQRDAIEALLRSLGGSPNPQHQEWANTLEQMAEQVHGRQVDATWNEFMSSVLSILPPALKSEPQPLAGDRLATARFLPTEDNRLLSMSDAVQIFFRPRRGADDAADFVGSIPSSLEQRIAFLNHDVRTHERQQQRNTEVQKFLDGRFVRSFRREDLLRQVVIPSLPKLPATHGSLEAATCADMLAWTLEMIGEEKQESLFPLLSRMPVACSGGWFAMGEATFGPGWAGRCGEHLKELTGALPDKARDMLLRKVLLPPNDPRWGVNQTSRGDLFANVGVVDGLRIDVEDPIGFGMSAYNPDLPDKAPGTTTQSAWNNWRDAVRGQIKPKFKDWFEYELQDVKVLAVLHREDLEDSARTALSDLILASLARWEEGWEEVTITKNTKYGGRSWSRRITSPLKFWLSTLPWLDDGHDYGQQPLRQRWFVSEALLRGQRGRFRHLSPLSLPLAHRLGDDQKLLQALETLGLEIYPMEDDSTGPALLEALADAKARNAMPAGGFDVFLSQVRHAWRHLDPDRGLPKRFLVQAKPRTLTVRTASELGDAYLPDHAARTRSLRQHGKPIVEMRPEEARRLVGIHLHELGVRRATGLEERCLIDGRSEAQAADASKTFDEANLEWLPVVLLTLAAHGGVNPRGPATEAWRQATLRLRRARVRQCLSIAVELLDAGQTVARSAPRAHWLSKDLILLLHRDVTRQSSYEDIAAACQAILDRQDLLKDLRLVLGSLAGRPQPNPYQIEEALDRAEIDAEALADIRHRWYGETSTLVDRIRPVAKLLDVSDAGLDAAATDVAQLTSWLSSKIPQWSTEELIAAARECRDDFEMGLRAWQALDDAATLPNWNDALRKLGGEYFPVGNKHSEDQVRRHLEEAARPLRAFARHVANTAPNLPTMDDKAKVFSKIRAAHDGVEMDAEWASLWWKVPFHAVLSALRTRYEGIPVVKPFLDTFDGVKTIDQLNSSLKQQGVTLEPDPLEISRRNQQRLDVAVQSVCELYEAWLAKTGADSAQSAKVPDLRLDASIYLQDWSEADLFNRAKHQFDNPRFLRVCADCKTLEEMRATLDIHRQSLERSHQNHQRQARKKAREDRTFYVGGTRYEVGGAETFSTLFARLEDLPKPIGPQAHLDELTPLNDPSAERLIHSVVNPGTRDDLNLTNRKTATRRGSPHLPGLVGIVGEMHAFRFLRSRFHIDERAWVSEFRTKVLPLQEGERDKTSDSLGYDFRFAYDGKTWCVEVKATTEDSTNFDLSSGQIDTANRIANKKDWRWRILRIRRVFQEQPQFDWLPNPFEEDVGHRLRLRRGSVNVEYTPSGNMESDV